MGKSMKDLGINQWSIDDRLALVYEIWDSIAPTIEKEPPDPELQLLLTQRMAEIEADPSCLITWEEMKLRLDKGA
jgi:putative addiction module component (TIGR02574 family)